MYLAKLEQRSSGEASIEREVIEPDEREEWKQYAYEVRS
jgi:hypothetical protein